MKAFNSGGWQRKAEEWQLGAKMRNAGSEQAARPAKSGTTNNVHYGVSGAGPVDWLPLASSVGAADRPIRERLNRSTKIASARRFRPIIHRESFRVKLN
jgi:hypothetical protein